MTDIIKMLGLEKNSKIEKITQLTNELINHELYYSVKSEEDIKIYMYYQVWCVWDFMTLVKSIQIGLTSTSVIWTPAKDPILGAYIYDILATEETDINELGTGHSSHFETYLRAMEEVKADTKPVRKFINSLQNGISFDDAINDITVPEASKLFVKTTLKHAKSPYILQFLHSV